MQFPIDRKLLITIAKEIWTQHSFSSEAGLDKVLLGDAKTIKTVLEKHLRFLESTGRRHDARHIEQIYAEVDNVLENS